MEGTDLFTSSLGAVCSLRSGRGNGLVGRSCGSCNKSSSAVYLESWRGCMAVDQRSRAVC